MRTFSHILLASLLAPLLASCIQDEPLNAECDITDVEQSWVEANREVLVGKPIITNDHVTFSIKKGTDRTAFGPRFTLTEGATLTARVDGADVEANGITRDFSAPQIYTTRSQDGKWSKDYSVSFNYPQPLGLMSFEHYELDGSGRYHVWYETDASDAENPRRDYWASGNGGYAFVGIAKAPADYPTASDPVGVNGNCIKLVTRATGSFGEMVGMPIAAGNLFIGAFNSTIAVRQPRQATRFGLQLVGGKPLRFEGFYKYTAGEVFTDKDKQVCAEKTDTADIYAVVYEVDPDNFVPLNGDDVLTSDRIVMLARIADPGEPQEWQRFSEPFTLMEGKSFDEERLRNDGYSIAVVITSSRQGAYFEGAVGSTLYVDELRIIWEGQEEPEEQ